MGTNLLSEFRGRCGDYCLVNVIAAGYIYRPPIHRKSKNPHNTRYMLAAIVLWYGMVDVCDGYLAAEAELN